MHCSLVGEEVGTDGDEEGREGEKGYELNGEREVSGLRLMQM